MDYVVKMALDNSFRRGETSGAQRSGEEAEEPAWMRLPAVRPTGSGISVTLWDEIPPGPSHAAEPFDDGSPEE